MLILFLGCSTLKMGRACTSQKSSNTNRTMVNRDADCYLITVGPWHNAGIGDSFGTHVTCEIDTYGM
jgi:hypothetical protein